MATKNKTKKGKPVPLFPKATKVKPVKSTAKFVSLTVTAVIPTQSYGNIQPRIEVSAGNFKDAKEFAMAQLVEFYEYAETKPSFLGKITVEEKVVAPAPKVEAPATTPSSPSSAEASAPSTPEKTVAKPEPVLKAEKAIGLAATEEAAVLIQDQIEKSTKIPKEFKGALLELCLKKRRELSPKQ